MTFEAARKHIATMTGKSLSTAEVTELLLEAEKLIGRRPDEIVGPNLRLRWIQPEVTYTLKLEPSVTDAGHLAWHLGYSNHRDDTLQKREHAILTDEMLTLDVQAAMPYLWMVTSQTAEPFPVPSWAQLVNMLGQAVGEMPATLAALPGGWIGEEAQFVDHTRHSLEVTATRNGMRARVRGTKDKEGPAPDAALVIDPVAALEAGPVLGWAFGSAFELATPLESVNVTLEMPGFSGTSGPSLRTFRIWPGLNDSTRLDSNVSPNYRSHSGELAELSSWHGPVDAEFPADQPRPFGATDTGRFGVVVTEAEKAKARARARQQRTIDVRNAAAAEAAAKGGDPVRTASPVREASSPPWWKFWAARN